jgi:hypothetical protein
MRQAKLTDEQIVALLRAAERGELGLRLRRQALEHDVPGR